MKSIEKVLGLNIAQSNIEKELSLTERSRQIQEKKLQIVKQAMSQISNLDNELNSLSVAILNRKISVKGKRGRPKKTSSEKYAKNGDVKLLEIVETFLKKAPSTGLTPGLSLSEIVKDIYDSGYKPNASEKDFPPIVYSKIYELMKNDIVVKYKETGQYARYVFNGKKK